MENKMENKIEKKTCVKSLAGKVYKYDQIKKSLFLKIDTVERLEELFFLEKSKKTVKNYNDFVCLVLDIYEENS